MDIFAFKVFKSEVKKIVFKYFRNLINASEAEEKAVISKHRKLSGIDIPNTRRRRKRQKIQFTEIFSDPVEYKVDFPRTFNKRALIKYAILSWFLPEFTSWELRETIRTRAFEKQYVELSCYTHSYDCCMKALFQKVDLSHSDLFGNLLKQTTSPIRVRLSKAQGEDALDRESLKRQVADFVALRLILPGKAVPKVFRRGYNDHGSCRPNDKSGLGEYTEDDSLEILQEHIELKRIQFLISWKNRIHSVLSEGYG